MSASNTPTLDAQADAERIIRLFEQMSSWSNLHHRSSQWLELLVESANAALEHAEQRDFGWKPDWAESEPKAYELMCEGLGILMFHGQARTYRDVIGMVYMDVASRGDAKHFGQFFTPFEVAQMMASMTLGDIDRSLYCVERPMTIMDPCCGSGVMLLAAASVLPRDMLDRGEVQFYGQDIDRLCVAMCRLNVRLYGLNRTPAPELDILKRIFVVVDAIGDATAGAIDVPDSVALAQAPLFAGVG